MNIDTGCILNVGDMMILRNKNDIASLEMIEKTTFIVHSKNIEAFSQVGERFTKAKRVLYEIQNKDSYTEQHCYRVYQLVKKIALKLGYSGKRLHDLYFAAKYHDVGKIYIDDFILTKPCSLTEEEYNVMKGHVILGQDLVIDSFNEDVYRILSQHHERIDGSGYPYGLKGDEISEEGRILAICDSFDAMITDRVYKDGKAVEEALAELKALSGTKYDSSLVDVLIDLIMEENK